MRKETKNNFTKEFYEKLYNVLSEKELKTYKVEENRMLMRGVKYQQKIAENGVVDYKGIEYRDKEIHVRNKQKRDIDYKKGTSKSWHMNSYEEFYNFNFKEEPIILSKEKPSLFDVTF